LNTEDAMRNGALCVANYQYIESAAQSMGLKSSGHLTFFVDRDYIFNNTVITVSNLAFCTATQIEAKACMPQLDHGTVLYQMYNFIQGTQDIRYQQLEHLDKRRIVMLIIGLMEGIAKLDRKNGFLWDIIS